MIFLVKVEQLKKRLGWIMHLHWTTLKDKISTCLIYSMGNITQAGTQGWKYLFRVKIMNFKT